MERTELEARTKEELIDLVLAQQAIIAELRDQVAQLQARVAQLEARLKRPPKTPQNSSLPPAQGQKKERPTQRRGKKRGPKVGHPGKSRERVDPDVTVACRVEQCPDCQADLSTQPQHEVGRSQVVELPPVTPVVVEAVRYRVTCPQCERTHTASYPPGMEPQRVFGPRIEAVVSYLHHLHHLSYARLQTVLRTLFGLLISVGALVNLVQRAAQRLTPAAEAIRDEIRASRVVGSDETGARVDGQTHWQWVFVTDSATYHVIADSRASPIIAEVMGDAVPLVWVRDLFSAQQKARAHHHQVCHAHQLRDLQYAIDAERAAWAYHFQRLLLRAQRLSHRRDTLPLHHYQRAVADVEAACDALLAETVVTPDAARLQQRYRRHRASLFVFLHHREVPYDNNAAERALRNSVIHRKVSGGFRSEHGADAHAIVASIADTARKRDQDAFAVLQELLGTPAPTTASATR